MAFSSSSSSSDNGEPSCSKACSKAYAQLHSQYDKLTDEFRKSQIDVLSYQAASQTNDKHGLGYFSLESDSENLSTSSLSDRMQPSGGYHDVPPPFIGTFMPPKTDLVFHTAHIAVETDHSAFTVQLAPQIASSFVQSTGQVKPPRHSIQPVETSIPAATPKPTILTQSKPVFNTAVRPVSVVVPKIMVTRPRLAHSPVTKSKSPIIWHITHSPSPKTSNSPPKVTAVKASVVSAAQAEVNAASVYGYYCLKSMFVEKLQLIINVD
nr:hypothetical protein [Tanacetum cinerariifolium]